MTQNFLAPLVVLIASATASAISLSQVDDFNDGFTDTEGWGTSFQGIQILPDGGPAGTGDGFLSYTSVGGFGANSRMVLPNEGNQWAGDYAALGVEALSLDLRNSGNSQFDMRLAIGNSDTWYATTTPTIVPAGTDWQTLTFDLSDSVLSLVGGGPSTVAQVLSDVQEIRFLSSVALPTIGSGGKPRGDQLSGTIGIDNVRVAIPEPSSALLIAGAGIGLFRRRVRG